MDLALIVQDAGYAVTLAQLALQAAQDATPFVEAAYQLLVQKTALTAVQRQSLQDSEAALRAQLNAPSIPADQP